MVVKRTPKCTDGSEGFVSNAPAAFSGSIKPTGIYPGFTQLHMRGCMCA